MHLLHGVPFVIAKGIMLPVIYSNISTKKVLRVAGHCIFVVLGYCMFGRMFDCSENTIAPETNFPNIGIRVFYFVSFCFHGIGVWALIASVT